LEAARVAEGEIGMVECCAAPMEPSLGKVAGFDSVAETRSLRLAIARNLVQPIYDSDEPKAGKIAELKWIRAQLDEVKKALPREGEQATALRTIIDNNYLRLLERLLSLLEKS
jgi:hypothetical protein